MKKEHNITMWQFIAAKLLTHIVAAIFLGIVLVSVLLNRFWLPYYIDHSPWPAPDPVFFQLDLQQYPTFSEAELQKSDASLQVLDESFQVIYSLNSQRQPGYQYSAEELSDLTFKKWENHMLRTDKFVNQDGKTVIVLLQTDYDVSIIFQQCARNYSLFLGITSSLIVILACISFIRSIYKPLQQNLNFINNSIAKTPYNSSHVDLSQVSLQETRLVLTTYNDMLDALEQIRQEKEHLKKQNHRLIANLSHDLKSPMTNLRGYAELLEQDVLSQEEYKQYLNHIHSNISSLNSMVELLSEQVKYQYNDYPLHLEYQDMNDFLREICANYYTIFEKQGFIIDIAIMEEPDYLQFDQLNMRRVYANLLDNILSHNPIPTQVQIATSVQPDCYLIQIKDNGTGIAPEDRDKIFEPFYQGDLSRTKQHSGLGLFVVKQILTKHNATIAIEQEAHYKTVFSIRFPLPDTADHTI